MIIDCQLKSLLKIYLKTVIVGFGQADVLGFTVPQMGADKSTESTPNSPICPNCLPKPKSLVFRWKKGFIGRP